MSRVWNDFVVTKEFLRQFPEYIFVFGDNAERRGKKGAATLRNEPNTFGFITKKKPCNYDHCFYLASEYRDKFNIEITFLQNRIERIPGKIFLISKIGSGFANRFNIFEEVILPGIQVLKKYSNVVFLFDPEINLSQNKEK